MRLCVNWTSDSASDYPVRAAVAEDRLKSRGSCLLVVFTDLAYP